MKTLVVTPARLKIACLAINMSNAATQELSLKTFGHSTGDTTVKLNKEMLFDSCLSIALWRLGIITATANSRAIDLTTKTAEEWTDQLFKTLEELT